MLRPLERFLPWYQGPDWPTAHELSFAWLLLALLVTAGAGLCWVEFGAWRLGYHTISFTSQHRPLLRWAVFSLILASAVVIARVWLQHTNGSYGGN